MASTAAAIFVLLLPLLSESLPTTGSLRTLALTNAENDQDQQAAVAQINPTTGAVSLHGNFSFAVTVLGLDCASAFSAGGGAAAAAPGGLLPGAGAGAGGPVYIALEGNGPNVMVIDAASGAVLSSKLLSVAYAVATAIWDPAALGGAGALVGIAQAPAGSIDYIAIAPATGDVTVLQHGLAGLAFPLPCESALSVATGRFYMLSGVKQTDDSDEELLTLDLTTGKVLATVPWPSKNKGVGYANSVLVFPAGVLAPAANESVGLWVVDHSLSSPPRLVSVDPFTGHSSVVATAPIRGSEEVTIPLGPSALILPGAGGTNATVAAIAFSDASQEYYLVLVDLVPAPWRSGGEGAGDGGDADGAAAPSASARAVKIQADGVQLFWAPAWVPIA